MNNIKAIFTRIKENAYASNFTETQLEYIRVCKESGYGWAEFASSVESQGYCTPRQEEVLKSMVGRIANARARKRFRRNIRAGRRYRSTMFDTYEAYGHCWHNY